MVPRERFAALARLPDETIDLAEAALLIAAEEYPTLDVACYLHRLDALAAGARQCTDTAASETERIDRLNHFLFVEQRFAGNHDHYYDRRNSFLNEVLDRRTGIPITLSLVYMEVARRLGLAVEGVGFPGHFLTKYVGEREIIIDPFFGQVLSERECRERWQSVVGRRVPFDTRSLRAASKREILVRLLSNLKQISLNARALTAALADAERILLLLPESARELRDRGLIYHQLECHTAALADLERFLQLAPTDETVDTVRALVVELQRETAHIH